MLHIRVVAILAVLAVPAYAGTLTPNSGVPEIAPLASTGNPSSRAFKAADDRMMSMMGAPLTGDADRDFISQMEPHHRGAVEMARIELQYGKDPALRRLAATIIDAQNREIAEMNAWRANHP